MPIEVFNRREQKYMLGDETYNAIVGYISEYMEPDAYSTDGGTYSISNIYYDTANDYLIRKSLSKPVYKEKLRLRTYGTPALEDMAFVEIKKKYKGIVNKRRTSMQLKEAYGYLDEGIRPDGNGLNRQVLAEIDYFKNYYELMPKVFISYDRRAYFGMEDDSFRVTFDTNIQTRRNDLRLESGAYGEQLLNPGQWLMEVKISGATPSWFTGMLTKLKLYPVSFSKYGTEYMKYLNGVIKETINYV